MQRFDCVIIGGGVVGTAIARELSRFKITLALLEKEAELAFGVSKSNSGIIHPGTQNPPDSLKGRLCVQGNILIRRIAKELGVHFQEVGELIVIFNKDDLPRLEQLKREGELLGVPRLQSVDAAWLREHEPNLSNKAIAALYAPTAGIISPYRLTYDLAENAMANGVEVFTGHEVTSLQQNSIQKSSIQKSDIGKCRPKEHARFTIITNHGEFSAQYIINAAGLHADDIARMIGITDIVIKPRKGEEYLLDKKREHIVNHILFPLPSPTSKGVLVIKTSDGNPMIGPTAEDVDDKTDLSTSDSGLQKVLANVQKMVPSISDRDIIAYFAGLRPVAGKDFIIRHESSVPGMVTVAGIQSPGLTAAPAIALLVTELLRNNGLTLKKKLFFKKTRKPTTHLFAIPLSLRMSKKIQTNHKATKTQRGPKKALFFFVILRDFVSLWLNVFFHTAHIRSLVKHDPAYGDIVCRCEMVSAKEVRDAIKRGARTLDGIKFRTRAQAGRCHGGFCTTRIMKIMKEELGVELSSITKRGKGSQIINSERGRV